MGICTNGVIVCPVCGRIHGGLAIGNYVKNCNFCEHVNLCEKRRLITIPRFERICPECLLTAVLKMIGGDYETQGEAVSERIYKPDNAA